MGPRMWVPRPGAPVRAGRWPRASMKEVDRWNLDSVPTWPCCQEAQEDLEHGAGKEARGEEMSTLSCGGQETLPSWQESSDWHLACGSFPGKPTSLQLWDLVSGSGCFICSPPAAGPTQGGPRGLCGDFSSLSRDSGGHRTSRGKWMKQFWPLTMTEQVRRR